MQDILATLENETAHVMRTDGQRMAVSCDSEVTFSSSELLAAALASCIVATLLPMFRRQSLPPDALAIRIKANAANVADGLDVEITLPACTRDRLAAFQRAVQRCPVRRALAAPVVFHWLTRE